MRETHRVRDAPVADATETPRRRRRPSARLVAAAAALAVLGAAAGLGWQLGQEPSANAAPLAPRRVVATAVAVRPGPSASTSVSPVRAAAPDWAAVLDGLDAARARAFAAGDAAGLAATYAPGSSALAADAALLSQLVSAGRTARGLRHTVRSVRQLSVDRATAVLQVRDVLAPYEVLGPDGSVVQAHPARDEAAYVAVVVRTPAGFRLSEVRTG